MEKKILRKLQLTEVAILKEIISICEKYDIKYLLAGGTLLGAIRHDGFIPWDDDLDIAIPRKDYNRFLKICSKELKKSFLLDSYLTNKRYWLPFSKIRMKDTELGEKTLSYYHGEKGFFVDVFPLDNASSRNSKLLKVQSFIVKKITTILFIKNIRPIEKQYSILKKIVMKVIKIVPIQRLLHVILNITMQLNKNESSEFLCSIAGRYSFQKETWSRSEMFPSILKEFENIKCKIPNQYDRVLSWTYGDYMKLPPKEKRETHNPEYIKFQGEERIYIG